MKYELKDILYGVSLISTAGKMDISVKGLTFDSRKVGVGFVFIAIKGTQVDGHNFIDQSIERGASVIVCEDLPKKIKDTTTYVQVKDASRAIGIMAANFYDNPSRKLKVLAVTGTNGKTTIVTLLYKLFSSLGHKSGMLSTVHNEIDGKIIPATHTTPDAMSINELFAQMVKENCEYCFMEASSHAIHQNRMAGIDLTGALFSNITHDHLDYHQTFDNYIIAKKKLFDELKKEAFTLYNKDDKRGAVMVQNTKAGVYSFGLKTPADYKGKILSNTFQGLEMQLDGVDAWFRLVGDFNASNMLAVYGCARLLGFEKQEIIRELSAITPASGRFEMVSPGQKLTTIVDYAHTPDALENVLRTINEIRTKNEKLITVIGCGGNRDKEKRPQMARIAVSLSDQVVLTSDNPRDEAPSAIIDDMKAGISGADFKKYLVVEDRKEAIKTAISLSMDGDIILVAGKGHETYQEIKGERHHFDDREVIRDILKQINN